MKLLRTLLVFTMAVGTATSVAAATATWNANTEPDLAGYKLSYGTQPGVHPTIIDVGKVTSYQFNPPPGRYYVVVQAYNTSGELSDKSAEVVVDIPSGSQPPPQTGVGLPNQPRPPTATLPPGAAPGLPPASLPNPNQPLSLVQPDNQTTAINTNALLTMSVGNLTGEPPAYRAAGLPPGLSINSSSGVINGVARTLGVFNVTVIVSTSGHSVSGNFRWSVVDTLPTTTTVNHPPAMDQVENQKSPVDWPVSFQLPARDPEGQPLTFLANGLPAGLFLNGSTGIISGSATALGSYEVTVTVSDGEKTTVRNFTWAVVRLNEMGAVSEPGSSATSVKSSSDPESKPADIAPSDDYLDVSGDFDGDGKADLATYRRSSSEWRIWTSGSNFATPMVMVWGSVGDRPVPADFNGDRVTDFAVYRPSTGTWHVSLSGTQTPLALQWGGPEDVPVPLDHDGDGKADLALIRNGGYDILLSSANYLKSVQVR